MPAGGRSRSGSITFQGPQQRPDALTANGFELTLSTDLAAGTAGGGLIVG